MLPSAAVTSLARKPSQCANAVTCHVLAHPMGACIFFCFCARFRFSFVFSALCFSLVFSLVLAKNRLPQKNTTCASAPKREKHNMYFCKKHNLASRGSTNCASTRLCFHRKGAVLSPKSIASASTCFLKREKHNPCL